MGDRPRHILVTGAAGYIGSAVVEQARVRGWFVTALGRAATAHPAVRSVAWRLGQAIPPETFIGPAGWPSPDALIHAAHQWDDAHDPHINPRGTDALIETCRQHALRLVFCSSVSAAETALNRYGRTKYAIERRLHPPAEIAARIGLVYGGQPASQWGTLLRLTRLFPLLPMLDAEKPVQPIHRDDLARALLDLTRPQHAQALYGLAAPTTLSFGAFLKATALHCHGRRLRLVSIPGRLALSLVDVAAKIPGLPRVDRERILGLMGLPTIDTAASLAELGLALRPLEQGLVASRRSPRKALLREGVALMSYATGVSIGGFAARRYWRALTLSASETGASVQPLPLAGLCHAWPSVLRWYEPPGRPAGEFSRRLYLAALVAEATPAGARAFYDVTGSRRWRLAWRVGRAGVAEIVSLPWRMIRRRRSGA